MSVKAVFGLLGGLVPVVWFGGLAIHFYQVNQAMHGLASKELMPTIVGLGALALLFCIPILIKLIRLVSGTTPKPKRPKPERNASSADDDTRGDFDPDAVIARYLAQKSAGDANFAAPDGAASRPGFGRKSV